MVQGSGQREGGVKGYVKSEGKLPSGCKIIKNNNINKRCHLTVNSAKQNVYLSILETGKKLSLHGVAHHCGRES